MTELAELSRTGYLPVAVDDSQGNVVLAPVAGFDRRASMFHRGLAGMGELAVRLLPVDRFVGQARGLAPGGRVRMVAHVGRCGSTLLANLLALRPATMVLKEPGALHPRDDPDLLDALVRYCRTVCVAEGLELVVKPTSWTCPALLDTLGAQADWLLLWRDPAAVVASELDRPPRWAERSASVERGPRIDRYAGVWAKVVQTFLPGSRPPGVEVRFLDYARLAADKPGALRAVQTWLALSAPGELPRGFAEEASRYSKSRDTRFDPGSRHRRRELDPTEAARVAELTAAALAGLRAGKEALTW